MTAISDIMFCPCFGAQPLELRRLLVRIARRMPAGTFLDGHMFGPRIDIEAELRGVRVSLPIMFGGWTANTIARSLKHDLLAGAR